METYEHHEYRVPAAPAPANPYPGIEDQRETAELADPLAPAAESGMVVAALNAAAKRRVPDGYPCD
jgi:hypothetical protein